MAVAAGMLSYLAVLLVGGYAVNGLVRYQSMPNEVAWKLAALHLPASTLASFVTAMLAPRAPWRHTAFLLVLPAAVSIIGFLPLPQRVTVAACGSIGLYVGMRVGTLVRRRRLVQHQS